MSVGHAVTAKAFEAPVTEAGLGKDPLPELSLQEVTLNHRRGAELVQTISTVVSSTVCLMQGAGRVTGTPCLYREEEEDAWDEQTSGLKLCMSVLSV